MLRWPRKRPLLHARDILPLPSEPRSCMPSAGILVCSQRVGHAAGRDLLQREMRAGIRVSAPRPPAPRGHRHGGAHPAAGRPPRLLATLFTPPGDSGWSFLFCSDARPCESTNMPPSAPRSIIHPNFHRARPLAVRRACVSRRERPLAFPCRIASRTARPPQGPHVAVQM